MPSRRRDLGASSTKCSTGVALMPNNAFERTVEEVSDGNSRHSTVGGRGGPTPAYGQRVEARRFRRGGVPKTSLTVAGEACGCRRRRSTGLLAGPLRQYCERLHFDARRGRGTSAERRGPRLDYGSHGRRPTNHLGSEGDTSGC